MKRKISIIGCLLAVILAASCSSRKPEAQVPPEKVMIFISGGFNNLSSWLLQDIQDMKQGYIPNQNDKNILLIIGKHATRGYATPTPPCLVRLYRANGVVVADTLKQYPGDASLCDKSTLRGIFDDIREAYPVDHYGLALSSHATGWLPMGYYANPDPSEAALDDELYWAAPAALGLRLRPSMLDMEEPLLTKSIMQEKVGTTGSVEMEIKDFADAIPMHLDYLMLDCCLMGCVEVAYALREKTDVIGFSQAEVMADGFDYTLLAQRLLLAENPETRRVCEDYIAQYEAASGAARSATISLVDCRQLDALAAVCQPLFEKYRDAIKALKISEVQGFGAVKHWFFDLEDVLVKAGIDGQETAALSDALERCVLYKGTTGQYYSDSDHRVHPVTAFCGLSMYMPSSGSARLSEFYQTLDWNQATKLIQSY
ncbi:MAG: hypothetical protein IJ652_00515 [Bacteroidales bacterium]|nr:hypothetical protein [Bacteroidales bacterium]